jgi:hypothetical protein
VILIYGVLAFLLGTSIGVPTNRLVAMGWPAFLIALPFFLTQDTRITKSLAVRLIILHLAVAWFPVIFSFLPTQNAATQTIAPLLFAIVVYAWTWGEIKKEKNSPDGIS